MAKLFDINYVAVDDGHGALTAGKRTPFIKEIGRYIPENEFNKAVAKLLVVELKRNGFKVLETAPTDSDTPLNARTALANREKVDLFISIHYNAITGNFATSKGEGISAHIDPNHSANTLKFAQVALKHLAQGTTQKNRGIVKQNLAVTRDTKMPAVLFELGFMDNNREALLMINKDFQKENAVELCKAVCECAGKEYKPEKVEQVSNPSKKPVAKPSVGASEHKVVKGDTLWALARKYNISVVELKKLNGLKSDVLSIGDTLKVSQEVYHTVQKGETLYGIAVKNALSVDELKKFNGLKSNTIQIGQKLRVK